MDHDAQLQLIAQACWRSLWIAGTMETGQRGWVSPKHWFLGGILYVRAPNFTNMGNMSEYGPLRFSPMSREGWPQASLPLLPPVQGDRVPITSHHIASHRIAWGLKCPLFRRPPIENSIVSFRSYLSN